MTILATLLDGRTIATRNFTAVRILRGTVGVLSVAIPELKVAEKALGIHLSTNPVYTVSPHTTPYHIGNVVGLSVYVGHGVGWGTSVGGQVIVIGF